MYYAKCCHPNDIDEKDRGYFNDTEFTLRPEDYHVVHANKSTGELYVCSQEIKLEKSELWDFVAICEFTIKEKGTYTINLMTLRRNLRTKNSKRSESAIYSNISNINNLVSQVLNNEEKIIIKTNGKYHINIDLNKPYSIRIIE